MVEQNPSHPHFMNCDLILAKDSLNIKIQLEESLKSEYDLESQFDENQWVKILIYLSLSLFNHGFMIVIGALCFR